MSKASEKSLNLIYRNVGRAVGDYQMIEDGDKILVGISGGKDSWTLFHTLLRLQRRAPIRYELIPVTIHPGFGSFDCDPIAKEVARHGLSLHIETTQGAEIIEQHLRPGSSYCAFCARLRRGALYGVADRLQCNKVALGHHLDDAIETLLLNQFYSGTLAAMSAKMLADNGRHTVIRPLIYVEEKWIKEWASSVMRPLVGCGCPQEALDDQKRQKIKALLSQLQDDIPHIKQSLLNALRNVQPRHLLDGNLISGSGKKKT
ncbi:tRNA 2-thiocytidine(32) synthetase TtcA [Desulfuromonas sp. AOP6]|uniref:tRNA 2-thiocytidine(32) synthetase TtcA n=1 Tax=Desulfuromonas sp. AOP6 TaxID=1566351 RepID=UPI001275F9DF|nr:tRNA 2-thiocytidine(32) synthetase TtcA [Desulfuromonas sp. AOP6]BCA81004.1 tRNA 2-thiocytidine biosynthesis protein TtcA [Desulfuromonas sp. AOP6]